jgi:hypothetical protein
MWRKPSDIAHWIAGCWDEECIDLAGRGYIAGYSYDRYLGEQPTDHEKECERSNDRHTNTGWTGQVVAGYASELFAEKMLSTHVTFFHDAWGKISS